MTITRLKELGCDVESGLHRCLDNETFYLTLVNKLLASTDLSKLKSALEEGNLDEAFSLVHGMKGVFGNLSITPVYDILSEMTELLRARTAMDYSPLMAKLEGIIGELKAA